MQRKRENPLSKITQNTENHYSLEPLIYIYKLGTAVRDYIRDILINYGPKKTSAWLLPCQLLACALQSPASPHCQRSYSSIKRIAVFFHSYKETRYNGHRYIEHTPVALGVNYGNGPKRMFTVSRLRAIARWITCILPGICRFGAKDFTQSSRTIDLRYAAPKRISSERNFVTVQIAFYDA